MDLRAIREAVEAAIRETADYDIEETILRASSALPPQASDFDRGMAAGFAAALLLELSPQKEQNITQINR